MGKLIVPPADLERPSGICECGCGQPTHISRQGEALRGYVKGWPQRYLPGHRRTVALAIRFWAKVEKTESCWLWKGKKGGVSGYGGVKINGRMIPAHRVAWEITFGPVPKGFWVLHHCDVRLCVNPNHLFLGTASDNMRDASAKGRLGWLGPRFKMTCEMRQAIIHRYLDGESAAKLVYEFNLSMSSIYRALSGHIRST